MAKRIYILCPVTVAAEDEKARLYAYVDMLEEEGNVVYYPARDTEQDQHSFDVCLENAAAIQEADEIHMFYNSSSKGSHFDLGVAFALDILMMNKKVFKVIEKRISSKDHPGYGFGFINLLDKWEALRNG